MEDFENMAEVKQRDLELERERHAERYIYTPLESKQRFYESAAEERQRKFKVGRPGPVGSRLRDWPAGLAGTSVEPFRMSAGRGGE